MQRSLRRIKHRIKRLVTSYVSPLGWAVTGLAIASLIAFTILSWHELLTMAIVFACMMVAAIMLSLGNTSFTATIDVSSRRVTVSDTVKVDVCVDNPGRTPTTSARGDLPIGDSHERFAIPMLAAGQSRQTTVEFTAVSRAVLPVGPLSIRKGDPFGLVRHEKKLVDQINVFIHPKTVMHSTPEFREISKASQAAKSSTTTSISTDCVNTSQATTYATCTGSAPQKQAH